MNTISLFRITYPKPPKGFSGIRYYEKTLCGSFITSLDTLEEIEQEIYTRAHDEFPGANWFAVSDESHPAGWIAGTL